MWYFHSFSSRENTAFEHQRWYFHSFTTCENTAFGVHLVKIKIDLTLKESNILYILGLNYKAIYGK